VGWALLNWAHQSLLDLATSVFNLRLDYLFEHFFLPLVYHVLQLAFKLLFTRNFLSWLLLFFYLLAHFHDLFLAEAHALSHYLPLQAFFVYLGSRSHVRVWRPVSCREGLSKSGFLIVLPSLVLVTDWVFEFSELVNKSVEAFLNMRKVLLHLIRLLMRLMMKMWCRFLLPYTLLLGVKVSRSSLDLSLLFKIRVKMLSNRLRLAFLVHWMMCCLRYGWYIFKSLNLLVRMFLIQEDLVDVCSMCPKSFFYDYF